MKNKALFLVMLMICLGFASYSQKNVIPKLTPLVKLISNSKDYDSCLVTIRGYMHYKFEDKILYISKEQADYLMIGGVWLSFSDLEVQKFNPKKFDQSYVEITGVFYTANNTDLSHQGYIRMIQDIRKLRKYY
jgi:hypothetical protein